MIDIIFHHVSGDHVFVRIDGTNVIFADALHKGLGAPIENLKLSKSGVIKEFPDLIDNPNWNKEAIIRFKEKMYSLENEDKRCIYIINELTSCGYIPKYKQKVGFRMEVLNGTINA